MTSPADLEALLAQRGAAGIEHPGGTLEEHLRRVERRLADLGLSREVHRPAPRSADAYCCRISHVRYGLARDGH